MHAKDDQRKRIHEKTNYSSRKVGLLPNKNYQLNCKKVKSDKI